MDYLLEVILKEMPEWWVIDKWPEYLYVILVTFLLSMVCKLSNYSMFFILAWASLGPKAPLVATFAAMAAFVSRKIFKWKNQNVVTKHIFVGMSCAAAALPVFFGLSLGGILFALEHFIDAIFAGKIYLVIFQWLANCSSQANLGYCTSSSVMCQAQPYIICLRADIGLLGAGLAFLWVNSHWHLMAI